MSRTLVPVDRQSDLVLGINQIIHRDLGNSGYGGKVRWTQYDGSDGSFILRNTSGVHRATLLAATSATATPSAANAVEQVTDSGLFIGAGKALRLYDAAGSDFVDLSSDADGGLVVGGTGTSAGSMILNGNIVWKSGTVNTVTLDHAATANRIVTVQDLAGTMALLGAANVGNLIFADNTHDIGAAGATRPRDLFLSRSASIGTNPASAGGVRLANATAINARNAGNSADIALVNLTAGDVIQSGQTGTRHDLLGTVLAPQIDPPTIDGQVTNEAQCKAWAYIIGAGVGAISNSYNVSGVVRNAAGDYTVSWDRDFNSASYAVDVTVEDNGLVLISKVNSKVAGSADIRFYSTASVLTDPDAFSVVAFGNLS